MAFVHNNPLSLVSVSEQLFVSQRGGMEIFVLQRALPQLRCQKKLQFEVESPSVAFRKGPKIQALTASV